MASPVESAINRIWKNYGDALSLADIANSAIMSRFHFSRVFRDATGVSPGRFLSAVRIYEAKRMLASTSLSVTEISLAVGYNSLGSFTNRFTDSVGLSPSRFRRLSRGGMQAGPGATVPLPASLADEPAGRGVVAGRLELPVCYGATKVYLGAFRTPIIQGHPSASDILHVESGQSVCYRLPGVPAGEWFIRAVAVADSVDPEPWACRSLLIGGEGSVLVAAGAVGTAALSLRRRSGLDLPILYAVPDLEPDGALGENSVRGPRRGSDRTAAPRQPRRVPEPVAWSERCRA